MPSSYPFGNELEERIRTEFQVAFDELERASLKTNSKLRID
jgi:hypothetical protein